MSYICSDGLFFKYYRCEINDPLTKFWYKYTGEFNYLWVRFYNDHSCQYNPYGDIENVLETWTTWSTITYNFDGVVYLSLPACSEAAPHGGYIPPYVLNHQVLPRLREDLNYGGVILWDRYYDATTNYSAKISPYVDLNLAKSSS